ncbi:MAG TPA: BatA domain-containing protein [Chthoniobacteraceae bacterium]|jgi:hypothetical protein|nr:BatA domain-containing protein [Chthoniobacteraceae bacterium]
MTFLNPWLLAGMAAIGAPILIHMLMKMRVKRMKWAAMRFLQVVTQRNERRLRVEDWLLLALRCLLLILLAIALARPAFRSAGGMMVGGGARTVVIALDNSYSMGLTDGGASRFDNGRKAAEEILDALPTGSQAAFLLFSDVARPVVAEPAVDLNLVKKMIGDSALTDRGSNVHPALSAALDILKRHASGQGQVFLITDGQATGWKELGAMRGEAAQSGSRITIVEPGPGEQPDLGVSALEMGSAMAPAGSAARFSVEATNYGKAEARNVTISLSIDGEPPGDQAVIESLPAGESRRVSLFGRLKTAGFHAVTAQLPPDHLAADDRRTMIVRAMDEVRVLLVAGDMGATPREGDAFFLRRALAPVADDENFFIKPRVVSVADLGGIKLADYHAVALLDVPQLDQQRVAELDKYVRDGGGLMIFPGDKTDPASFDQALGGMLPATMGAPWGDSAGKGKFRTLQAADYTHPVVSIWQDPASGTLSTARFYKGITLQPLPASGPDEGQPVTILKYQDGAPAIVERTWGRGRVIEFSSTANAAWNDLPAHPAFVPLMQRVLGRLVTRRDDALNIPVGGVFTWPAQPDWLYKEMTVKHGAAAPESSKVVLVNGAPELQYGDTDLSGVYDVSIDTQPPVKLSFAAQSDPEESKLDPISDADLKTLAQGTQVIHWGPETSMRQALGGGNSREFWSVFAALALAVACCEMFLAGRFSASK